MKHVCPKLLSISVSWLISIASSSIISCHLLRTDNISHRHPIAPRDSNHSKLETVLEMVLEGAQYLRQDRNRRPALPKSRVLVRNQHDTEMGSILMDGDRHRQVVVEERGNQGVHSSFVSNRPKECDQHSSRSVTRCQKSGILLFTLSFHRVSLSNLSPLVKWALKIEVV